MTDYRTVERAIARLDRWLLRGGVVLTIALLGTVAASVFWPEHEPAATLAEHGGGKRDSLTGSIPMGEVAGKTRGRAPFRTGRVQKVKEVDELGSYRLIGTSIRGDKRKAYVRDLKRERVLPVETGDVFGSYEVLEIFRDLIKIRKGSDELVLRK